MAATNLRASMAELRIARAKQIIEEQKNRIERLRAVGASDQDARFTLEVFERNLQIFESYRDDLKTR